MGDNVIDDAQVIFEIESDDSTFTGGGDTGKVILQNVTLTIERPTNGYSGIGNEGETAVGYGTLSATLDHEQVLNERAAKMLANLYNTRRSPAGISILAGDVLETTATKFDWNELEQSYEDDGDQMVTISGKVRGIDMEANP